MAKLKTLITHVADAKRVEKLAVEASMLASKTVQEARERVRDAEMALHEETQKRINNAG